MPEDVPRDHDIGLVLRHQVGFGFARGNQPCFQRGQLRSAIPAMAWPRIRQRQRDARFEPIAKLELRDLAGRGFTVPAIFSGTSPGQVSDNHRRLAPAMSLSSCGRYRMQTTAARFFPHPQVRNACRFPVAMTVGYVQREMPQSGGRVVCRRQGHGRQTRRLWHLRLPWYRDLVAVPRQIVNLSNT